MVPMSRNLGALTLLDPSGPAWPVMGVLYLYLYLYLYLTVGITAHHTCVTTVYKKMSICDIASVTVSLSETNRMIVTGHFSDSNVSFVYEYCTDVSIQVT
jgi:hypothetical protein